MRRAGPERRVRRAAGKPGWRGGGMVYIALVGGGGGRDGWELDSSCLFGFRLSAVNLLLVSTIMLFQTVFGLAAAATTAFAASLQQVSSFGSNPTKINMYIYVPDKVAPKPAIIVAVRL